MSAAPAPNYALSNSHQMVSIDDSRYRFQPEENFPEPRGMGAVGKKVYRSGKGCSVPLDLKALE